MQRNDNITQEKESSVIISMKSSRFYSKIVEAKKIGLVNKIKIFKISIRSIDFFIYIKNHSIMYCFHVLSKII